jgi:hypothetical protein
MLIDGLIDHDEAIVDRAKLMGEKRTLEEEVDGLSAKPSAWLEPFRDWILTAQRVRSVADSTILTERAALAKKIFRSNLVLENAKARGKAVNPWSYLTQRELGDTLVNLFYAARTYFQNEAAALGATPTQATFVKSVNGTAGRLGLEPSRPLAPSATGAELYSGAGEIRTGLPACP